MIQIFDFYVSQILNTLHLPKNLTELKRVILKSRQGRALSARLPLRPERKTICGRRWSAAEVDRLSEDRGEMMMRSSSQERLQIGR